MSGRHQPEHGADSAEGLRDIFDDVADYLVADAFLEALKDDCPLCHGAGEMMGGDEYQPCPKCKGQSREITGVRNPGASPVAADDGSPR